MGGQEAHQPLAFPAQKDSRIGDECRAACLLAPLQIITTSVYETDNSRNDNSSDDVDAFTLLTLCYRQQERNKNMCTLVHDGFGSVFTRCDCMPLDVQP